MYEQVAVSVSACTGHTLARVHAVLTLGDHAEKQGVALSGTVPVQIGGSGHTGTVEVDVADSAAPSVHRA